MWNWFLNVNFPKWEIENGLWLLTFQNVRVVDEFQPSASSRFPSSLPTPVHAPCCSPRSPQCCDVDNCPLMNEKIDGQIWFSERQANWQIGKEPAWVRRVCRRHQRGRRAWKGCRRCQRGGRRRDLPQFWSPRCRNQSLWWSRGRRNKPWVNIEKMK